MIDLSATRPQKFEGCLKEPDKLALNSNDLKYTSTYTKSVHSYTSTHTSCSPLEVWWLKQDFKTLAELALT